MADPDYVPPIPDDATRQAYIEKSKPFWEDWRRWRDIPEELLDELSGVLYDRLIVPFRDKKPK